jgi:hypothetical protein
LRLCVFASLRDSVSRQGAKMLVEEMLPLNTVTHNAMSHLYQVG